MLEEVVAMAWRLLRDSLLRGRRALGTEDSLAGLVDLDCAPTPGGACRPPIVVLVDQIPIRGLPPS